MPFMVLLVTALAAALCVLLVQPAKAEPVDSPPIKHQAFKQERTEPKEITIHISGEHKSVVAALLDAVDDRTTVTGLADFDSLSAAYGLMGIHREGGMSSGFYGYRFRLAFPAATDVEAIDRAYRNLPYIKSVAPPGWLPRIHSAGGGKRPIGRIFAKLFLGGVLSAASAVVFLPLFLPEENPEVIDLTLHASIYCGILVGFPLGVTFADPHDSFSITILGGLIPTLAGMSLVRYAWGKRGEEGLLLAGGAAMLAGPIIGSLYASEKWRKPPKDRPKDRRLSFGLTPNLNGGLSAVTTLRF